MNSEFFSKCPFLMASHVTTFYLLKCVHVFTKGSEEKDFSIHCDADYKSMAYAGEDEEAHAPRYSGVEYTISSEGPEVYQGQVVGIISYKPRGHPKMVYLLINRFVTATRLEYINRALPVRLVQYECISQQVTTDCIPIGDILDPLFVVPALDKGMAMGNVCGRGDVKAKFYVYNKRHILCVPIMSYDEYLSRNNTRFSHRHGNVQVDYMNYNPFLTIEDMQNIKELFDVDRNIEPYDNDLVEAYDFNLDDDEDDY